MSDSGRPAPETPDRRRLVNILFRGATEGLSALVLFLLMVMTCVDVFGREVLRAPLDGATELTRLMLGILVFGVLPIVSFREEHVSVDLLDRWFPDRLARARRIVLNLLMSGMMGVVCWRVWIVGYYQIDYGDATEFLRIPLGPVSYFISVLSGLAAVTLLVNAVRHATGRGGARGDEAQVT